MSGDLPPGCTQLECDMAQPGYWDAPISEADERAEYLDGVCQNIKTSYAPKPIPDRRFDWEAIEGDYDLGKPIGYGRTEGEAVSDLLEQIEAA